MKVKELRVCDYELPLRVPIKTARGTITVRRGFIVAAVSPEGLAGVGEVAPLPEFGTEDYETARNVLAEAASELANQELPDDYRRFSECIPSSISAYRRPSACRFGVDCALAGLAKLSRRSWSVRPHLAFDHRSPFLINALIGGDSSQEILKSAEHAVASGYHTLKLKIGILAVDEEVHAIRSLCAAFPGARLRLDANCSLSASAVVEFCERIQVCAIEYIEDPAPLGDLGGLAEIRLQTNVRIAVDELLPTEMLLKIESAWEGFDVLVLKPSRVGSMADLATLEEKARSRGKQIVYTSMYESSLGIACILGFMRPGASPELAHGLGTAHFFSEDTLKPRMLPESGLLKVVDVRALAWMLKEPYRSRLGIA